MTGFSDFRGALGAAAFLPGTGLDMEVFTGISSLLAAFLTGGREAGFVAALDLGTALTDLLGF
ncbi:MAG: hypothetical protein Q8M93_20590 [Polaromonas sp.]|uniref:hypothetical protein n=1 Tax=Polaromonas sp. TaxID=1869339 RepID=UPI0027335736|nr:hypothetical protein [Polaromonas sp.]MDP3249349.1 hypothetical protein [Polaromonas sp.]MDP3755194.1 hypothetical protein [Polaromonas sp.]